jgi:DNA-directed RNA polymerase subunit H (RpoH/RPB5)
MTKLQTITRSPKQIADAKRQARTYYDASKELREIHDEEFKSLLNKYKLKAGILPRELANKHRADLVEQLRESEGQND